MVSTAKNALTHLEGKKWDAIITDVFFSDGDYNAIFPKLRKASEAPIFIVTTHADEEAINFITSMKNIELFQFEMNQDVLQAISQRVGTYNTPNDDQKKVINNILSLLVISTKEIFETYLHRKISNGPLEKAKPKVDGIIAKSRMTFHCQNFFGVFYLNLTRNHVAHFIKEMLGGFEDISNEEIKGCVTEITNQILGDFTGKWSKNNPPVEIDVPQAKLMKSDNSSEESPGFFITFQVEGGPPFYAKVNVRAVRKP